MIDMLYFDTDCLSAFLWVGEEGMLTKLYPNRIVIPEPVYVELSRPSVPHLRNATDVLLRTGQVILRNIEIGTEEYTVFYQLTEEPTPGHRIIGKGEAASIALAKTYGGAVASNNLRDINVFIEEYGLGHFTTGDIMVEAYRRNIIGESQGNVIWSRMLSKRRKLGANSFTEYLEAKSN